MKNYILQAVTNADHAKHLNNILDHSDTIKVILSTAFMTERGLSLIESTLSAVASQATVFAGVRNGITTAQALEKALNIGCTVYAVDTGSRTRIFHPKVYFQKSHDKARLIVGSANLTVGGLLANIEASLLQDFDTTVQEDADFLTNVEQQFHDMIDEYPEHVIKISARSDIEKLLETGRVLDESETRAPAASSSSFDRGDDQVPLMKLKTKRGTSSKISKFSYKFSRVVPTTLSGKPVQPSNTAIELLWESKELRRRDLDIPKSKTTHATGSMLWKKGASAIDQQTYFRDRVFANLTWQPSARTPGKEEAEADFQIIIRGIDYGLYRLTVTHDTRKNTAAYKQRQPMTDVRWGEASPLIARTDLLERIMRLYRDPAQPDVYIIDID